VPRALTLNGSADYVTLPTIALAINTPFTLAAWVKKTDVSGIEQITGFDAGDSDLFRFNNAKLNYGSGNDAAIGYEAGVWHHYAITRSASGAFTAYQDGVNVTGTARTDAGPKGINQLARVFNGTFDRYLNGQLAHPMIWNRALSAVEIDDLYDAGSTLNTGLLLRYKFNEAGGTSATNYAATGPDGTYTNITPSTDRVVGPGGSVDWGMTFDGTTSYVDVGTVPGVTNLSSISLAGWFRSSQADTTNKFLCDSSTDQFKPMFFGGTSGKLGLIIDGLAEVELGDTPNDGAWHHLAFTVSGTTAKSYLDGVELSSKTLAGTPSLASVGSMKIGSDTTGASNFFTGDMADVRLYARTLDLEDVTALANLIVPRSRLSCMTSPVIRTVHEPNQLAWTTVTGD